VWCSVKHREFDDDDDDDDWFIVTFTSNGTTEFNF
jgi:hypothetical protein